MLATLLLNASYEPLRVIPWHKAIVLALLQKADILETYEGVMVHSAHAEFPWPSVARLRTRVAWRNKSAKFNRKNVFRRDNYTCQFCGKHCEASHLTFDHVIPRALGGITVWSNIVTACIPCNQRKGGRTPQQAGMKLLSEPKDPGSQVDLPKVWNPKSSF
jgi:5-methylcytosine-specific restriction endonuclease McrA